MTRHGFHDLPLAVVGMACRLPGADGLDAYWRLVREGRSAIGELPGHRLDAELYFDPGRGVLGKSYTKLGGLVPDRPMDRSVCPVSDAVVADSDPSHAAMLEVAAAACRHAGLDPFALPIRNTGVYIGHARGSPLGSEIAYATQIEDVTQCLAEDVASFAALPSAIRDAVARELIDLVRAKKPRRRAGGRPDVAPNAAAGLIAECFGLCGPYTAVDAVCASSLYALALAAHALQAGRVDMAIVGGASYSSWQSLIMFAQAQALSATGSCPFDARADGFVSADGYVAILVKTLPRALADGDSIHGVVRGIGLASDGRGKSLWAPRADGQIEAMKRTYGEGVDPARIQYVEAHGTSTQLGDATEIRALCAAIGARLPAGTRIPIGSVKGNIGHARETAGLAGLVKTLLAMRHAVVPPAANFEIPNPEIEWEHIPFFVPRTALEWPAPADGLPRRAAVDAFGIGGLNAHLVVDQFVPREAPMTFRSADVPGLSSEASAVAIIGLGAIFPGAHDVAAYWDLLVSGRDPKCAVPPDRWNAAVYHEPGAQGPWRVPTRLGGFVTEYRYDWKRHKVPPRQIETADPLQFMVLDAVEQALADAGYGDRPFDRRRTAVVVGTIFGGDFVSQLSPVLHLPELERDLREVLKRHGADVAQTETVPVELSAALSRRRPMLRDETGSYSASTLASRVARTLDLMGGALAVDSGEASSMTALTAGIDMLRSGACDLVLCAGAQRAMDTSVYVWASMRGLLAPDAPLPAFGREAAGLVPGEGVAVVVLKRLTDARRDGDPIRAILRGVGVRTECGAPGAALRGAIEQALSDAGASAGEIAAVEAVGSGVRELDRAEAEALVETYGSESRVTPLLVASLATQIGHTFGASGMASLLKMVLALRHRQLPSGPMPETPLAVLAGKAESVSLTSGVAALAPSSPTAPALAGVSSVAFRGLAYHVVVEAERAELARAVEGWRIIRLGATTLLELAECVKAERARVGSLLVSGGETVYADAHRARLAIVARNEAELGKRLQLAATQMAEPGARRVLEEQGIVWGIVPATPRRVAMIFSGQGSQYAGMLRSLTAELPVARETLREIDDLMSRLGHRTFSDMAWQPGTRLGEDVWETQASILLADTILHAALRSLGIHPDVVCGHSYGEYPALVAAGAWTLEQAIRVTRARCELIEASPGARGVMLSTTAPREIVERMTEALGGAAWIANHNAPDQSVIGGEEGAVTRLAAELTRAGYAAQPLPVPRPFHTPLLADVRDPLQRVLNEARILPPRIPLLSSVTNRYVSDPFDIRDNLVDQLTRPVAYVDLIERLIGEGTTVLLEVGPGNVLTRLHRRIAGDRDAVIVATDNPKRPGLEQLVRAQAALECVGLCGGARADARPAGTPATARASRPAGLLHFDATLRRKQKTKTPARVMEIAPDTPSMGRQAEGGRLPSDGLAAVLIRFVCEETGYPPEVVELDADLEADLGIDSIKKARLLGELRDRFRIEPESMEKLSLDDFPTLRHVLDFLQGAGADADVGRVVATVTGIRGSAPVAEGQPSAEGLVIVDSSGSPYEIGVRLGRTQSGAITRTLEQYATLLGRGLDETESNLAAFDGLVPSPEVYFTPATLEELRGMAEAVQVPLAYLIAFNLGLYPEYVGGCVQFAVPAERNGSVGLLHAVNEDWPLLLRLPDALTSIVQVRHPADGIAHVLFSVAGQIGGLTGLNARGVAVTSTMLLDREWRSGATPGTIHPVLVQTILERAEDVESAIEIVRGTERTGAWSLCISHHPTDRVTYLEYDGPSLQFRDHGAIITANHCLLHAPRHEVPEHSRNRLARLQALLEGCGDRLFTVELAQATLRDRYDLGRRREAPHPTMNTIQRVDNRISVVMRPAKGEIWVTPGPVPRERADRYQQLDARALLAVHPEGARGDRRHEPSPSEIATEAPPRDHADRIMSRFILRTIEAPLERSSGLTPSFRGPALIVGTGPWAAMLTKRLTDIGVPASQISPLGDRATLVAALDRLWAEHPIPHLFLVAARDEPATPGPDELDWARLRDERVLAPYFICQRWTTLVKGANLLDRATLVAATALGGDFGFAGRALTVEGGALTGLLKAIRREFDGLIVKVVDGLPEESPARVVDAIFAELASGTPAVEVGYVRGQRRIVRAVPRPLSATERRTIPRGSVWVMTGGGRGITAFVARELGRRFGLRLHLLGTSPVPRVEEGWRGLSDEGTRALKMTITRAARERGRDPSVAWSEVEKAIEIDGTLRALAGAGIEATYHCCDVADREALARTLERVRERTGPISGIIHGAGLESSARFDRKSPDTVAAAVAAKVGGAVALMELTRQDPLEFFVGFASVSGRFGGLGQTDYSLASDMLAKLVHRFRRERPECASVALHWPPWDDIGMAARPESKLALEMGGQSLMPPREGIVHLLDELGAGAPEGEVLFLDKPSTLDLDHTLPTPAQRAVVLGRRAAVADAPLIEGVTELEEGRGLVAEIRFDPTADPFLAEHLFQGVPLLPSVIAIEALVEGAHLLVPEGAVVELCDVEIGNMLRFYDGRPQDARVRIRAAADGFDTELSRHFFDRRGRLVDPNRTAVKSKLILADGRAAVASTATTGARGAWHTMQFHDADKARGEGIVFHGPRLRCLHEVSLSKGEGWGRIVAPPMAEIGGARRGRWRVPAVALDACLVVCGIYARRVLAQRQLPQGFGRVRLGRLPKPGEACVVHVELRRHEDQRTYFDFILRGTDDTVILEVADYCAAALTAESPR